MADAIKCFCELMTECMPFVVAWGMCTIVARTTLSAVFGGRLEL